MSVDWSRWSRVGRAGWERVPPPRCPLCGTRWTARGPGRPAERNVGCTCTAQRRHTVWRCPSCGAFAAEGCTDVTLWVRSTAPVDLPDALRVAV